MKLMNLGRTGLFVVLFVICHVFAFGNNKDYSSAVRVKAIGSGKVYANSSSALPSDASYTSEMTTPTQTTSAPTHTYYIYAKANDNNVFAGWYTDESCTNSFVYSGSVSVTAAQNTNTVSYYAKFIDYASASLTNGVSFTNLIVNPGFESSTWNEGWTTEGFVEHENAGQFGGQHIAEIYCNPNDGGVASSGKVEQTINNLPAGFYKLSAKATGGVGNDKLYAKVGDKEIASTLVPNTNDVAKDYSVYFEITETSNVTIGFARVNSVWWSAVDDFSLTYFGQMPNDYVKSGDLSGYLYTIQDGEYVAFGRGANWETQATATNPDGLDVSVNINNYIATIKYTDMSNVYVYDAGGNNVFTDGATASQFYVQESNGKYKFILASDMSKALGVGTDVYNNAHEGFTPTGEDVPVIKIVDAANAPVWKFADTGVTMVIGKTKPYGTFVAPFDVTLPEGVTAYQVSEIADNGVLSLTSSFTGLDGRTLAAGTPVIVEKNAELNETIYGTTNTSITSDVNSNGYLVGMYAGDVAADSYIPYGSAYVLQKKSTDTEPKFYKVAENKVHKVAYRAYLYNPANIEIKAIKVVEDGEVSAVSSVDIEATVVAIYSVSGAKINAMQKGLNVVKMSDGSIKKILVK